jgi:hypothetical protein
MVSLAGSQLGFSVRSFPQLHRAYGLSFAPAFSLSVYPVRTDCLCLVDSGLFTFVYVNDGWIHDETFDHRRIGPPWALSANLIEIFNADPLVGFRRTTTKEPQ